VVSHTNERAASNVRLTEGYIQHSLVYTVLGLVHECQRFKLELGVWFGKLQVSWSNCPGETFDLVKMYEKIKEKILVAFGPLSKRQ